MFPRWFNSSLKTCPCQLKLPRNHESPGPSRPGYRSLFRRCSTNTGMIILLYFPIMIFFILLWEFRLFYYIFGTAHFLEKLKSFERTPKHLQTKYVSELCLFLIQMQQSSFLTIGIPNISFQQTNLFKKHNLPRGSYFIIASQTQEHWCSSNAPKVANSTVSFILPTCNHLWVFLLSFFWFLWTCWALISVSSFSFLNSSSGSIYTRKMPKSVRSLGCFGYFGCFGNFGSSAEGNHCH